jgi:hypothetical protein
VNILNNTNAIDATLKAASPTEAAAWRRWLALFLAFTVAGLVLLYVFIVLIDPYATGRFALTDRLDRVSENQFFAKAGIIRDPQFDAAIIGASTAASIDPAPVSAETGRNFAQLSFYGTYSRTHQLISRVFEKHHSARQTLQIIVLEWDTCMPQFLEDGRSFPHWLYESSNGEYLRLVFNVDAAKTAWRRLLLWLGLASQSLPANGFATIFPEMTSEEAARRVLATKPDTTPIPADAPFATMDALTVHLNALDTETLVLLTYLPVFINAFPPAGSIAQTRDMACRQRIDALARSRPKTAFLDLRHDGEMARDVASYVDAIHFRGRVARMVEAELAQAVRALILASR